MEGEKKRKRAEEGAEVGGGGRRRKEREAEATPTEEEVEEFYAILRRMRMAIKYFEKGKGNTNGRKLTGKCGTALEAEVLPAVDGVKAGVESVNGARENVVLDLNVVPEAESNSV